MSSPMKDPADMTIDELRAELQRRGLIMKAKSGDNHPMEQQSPTNNPITAGIPSTTLQDTYSQLTNFCLQTSNTLLKRPFSMKLLNESENTGFFPSLLEEHLSRTEQNKHATSCSGPIHSTRAHMFPTFAKRRPFDKDRITVDYAIGFLGINDPAPALIQDFITASVKVHVWIPPHIRERNDSGVDKMRVTIHDKAADVARNCNILFGFMANEVQIQNTLKGLCVTESTISTPDPLIIPSSKKAMTKKRKYNNEESEDMCVPVWKVSDDPLLRRHVYIECSFLSVESCKVISDLVERFEGSYVEMQILEGAVGVENGCGYVVMAGKPAAVKAVLPVLKRTAKRLLYSEQVGDAVKFKTIMHLYETMITASCAHALNMVSGINDDVFKQIPSILKSINCVPNCIVDCAQRLLQDKCSANNQELKHMLKHTKKCFEMADIQLGNNPLLDDYNVVFDNIQRECKKH